MLAPNDRPARLPVLVIVALLAAIGFAAPGARAAAPPAKKTTIDVGGSPVGVAVDPTTHAIYVTQPNTDTVDVIDGTTDTVSDTPIAVGDYPYAVAVDAATHTVYVANALSSTVSVIDGATRTVTDTVTVGDGPQSLAFDAVSHTLYVGNGASRTVSVIDASTNTVTATVPVSDSSVGIAVDPSSGFVYATSFGRAEVEVIDGATNEVVAAIPVGDYPNGVTVDPSTHQVFVANAGNATVSVIDGTTRTVTDTLPVGQIPAALAVDPSTHVVYVVDRAGSVAVIDGTSRAVTATVPDLFAPFTLDVDVATHRIYVTQANGAIAVLTSPPSVTGVSPSAGPVTGGTEVTITGTGFADATAVEFGSGPATSFTIDSDTHITAVAPPSTAIRDRHIWVTTPDGVSEATSADLFSYTGSVPAITGVSPSSGPLDGGTEVTITGSGFTDATEVTFGAWGQSLPFVVDSDTQITATVPSAAQAGVRNIRVRTAAAVSPVVAADRFTYVAPAPAITEVSPASGPLSGNTKVTITGSGFSGATRVIFGAAGQASFLLVNDNLIVATSPRADTAGMRHVRVRTASGTSPVVIADRFKYVAP